MRQPCAFVLAAILAIASASAQTYPSRPIRLIIPYPPGGVMDAVGRPWADRMKPLLGTIVVENVSGGGGEIAAVTVARARPDGYVILLANSSVMVINPLASSRAAYDPIGSFDAVSIITYVAQAIAVHPSLPVRTLKDLAVYARRNPGALSYATPGVGTLNHLTGERFKQLIGSPEIVHVPYRGAGPAVADLIGGQIPIAIAAVNGQLLAYHRAGRVRILAVTSAMRLEGAPDLATVNEAGVPQLIAQALNWVLVPKRTPREVIDQIASATRKVLAEPELRQIYVASGIEPSSDTSPEAATRLLQEEIVRWRPVVQRIALKLD